MKWYTHWALSIMTQVLPSYSGLGGGAGGGAFFGAIKGPPRGQCLCWKKQLRMYVRTHTAYSSSSVLLRPPDPRPQTKDLLLLLRPPDPRPQTQNLLLLLRPPDPRPQPPDPKPYVSFRKQRRSPLNWNARRQRGRASSHHGGEYVPPGRNQGKSHKFPQEPARGRRARGQPRPNRSRRTDPFPMRLPRGQRLPTYVRTYLRTLPYLRTYLRTYVRTYRDCYVRT